MIIPAVSSKLFRFCSIAISILLISIGFLMLAVHNAYLEHPAFKYITPISLHPSTIFSSFLCPDPLSPTPPAFPYSYTSDQCQDLAVSPSSNWSVRACLPSNRCNSASIFITPMNLAKCRDGPGRALHANQTLDKLVTDTLGPAEFRLKVDGAEVWSTGDGVFSSESCEYRFDVGIRNSGLAVLSVWQFYDNYDSFDDLSKEWPVMLLTPLLDQTYSLPNCPSHCPTLSSPPIRSPELPPLSAMRKQFDLSVYRPGGVRSNSTVYLTQSAGLLAQNWLEFEQASRLPSCPTEARDTMSGSYLPLPRWSRQFDIYPDARQFSIPPTWSGYYAYQPHGCSWRHAGIKASDHAVCVGTPLPGLADEKGLIDPIIQKGLKQVLVVGDSHGRVAYDGLLNRMKGSRMYQDQSAKFAHEFAVIGSTNFTFIWDPSGDQYLGGLACDTLQTLSSLVVSVGHHPASRAVPPETFVTSLRFIHELDKCPGPSPSLIFMTPPPQPPRNDVFVREHRDHRTHTRLRFYSKLLRERIFATTRWKLVDSQMLLQPYIFHPIYSDSAHYLGFDGQEAVLDELIAKMGICGQTEVDVPGPVIES